LIELTRQEVARRLIRSRNWRLKQAGEARLREVHAIRDVRVDVELHERAAADCEAEIRALGFDPQPPMGPRAA
jgi:hypothetical protein